MGTVKTTQPRRAPAQKSNGRYDKVSAIYRLVFMAMFMLTALSMICFIVIAAKAADESATAEEEPFEVKVVVEYAETEPEAREKESAEPAAFFPLTIEQRELIEQVVSAESRGEPYEGQMAVAQCILNACLKYDITPEEAIKKNKYTGARAEPTESVKEAVAAIFDHGETITEEPIIYFYAPAIVSSSFHESQTFVTEIAGHRFFKEAE